MKETAKNLKIAKVFFIFLIFLFPTCIKKTAINFDERLIEKIANERTDLPSRYIVIAFYTKCKENKIAKVDLEELKRTHKLSYPNLDFKAFLTQVLNQQIIINYPAKNVCFDLDKDIKTFYERSNFDAFLKIYTKKTKSNQLILKREMAINQFNTVSYYLFLHNYLVFFDDYIGIYKVISTSSYLAKE